MRPPRRGDVAAHGVRGQEVDVAVAAAGEYDDVREVGLDLAGDHVAGDDAAGLPVDDDHLEHLVPGVHRHGAGRDLPLQRLVGADQQLLAGLAAGVERAGDLHATEGAVVEQAAVLAGERDALGDALVDDAQADLGQAVDVRLARAVVAALDRVVEQPLDRVAVALVVLGGVDAALRGDRVGAARGVLVAEGLHHVAASPSVAAAEAPARPVPTMITDRLRRLAGAASRASNLRVFQRSSIGPPGALWSTIGAAADEVALGVVRLGVVLGGGLGHVVPLP